MIIKLISDNHDTMLGFRLAGIEGVHPKTKEEVISVFNEYSKDENTALVLITEKIYGMCSDFFDDVRLNLKKPLVTVVPGPDSDGNTIQSISKCVNEAIGIKI